MSWQDFRVGSEIALTRDQYYEVAATLTDASVTDRLYPQLSGRFIRPLAQEYIDATLHPTPL